MSNFARSLSTTQKLNKYNFPCVSKISHIKFDIHKLREALHPFYKAWTDVHTANQGLCLNHQELSSAVESNFFQVSLTKCSSVIEELFLKTMRENKTNEMPKKQHIRNKIHRYRQAISQRTNYPWLDEHNWNKPIKLFRDSYFQKCVQQFQSPAIRVRLTTLQAGTNITPHIDYDVNYAVRIVVPIYTNEKCFNYFWYRGKKIKHYIPADGHPYFLNVGLKHSVENRGKTDRIVFMFSLANTKDIHYLQNKQTNNR